jgi:hypothetical protein
MELAKRYLVALFFVLALCIDTGCVALYPEPPCPADRRCETNVLAFESMEPELDRYVEAMAIRLAKATGRKDIRVEAGGIPVRFRERLLDPEDLARGVENEVCAHTVSRFIRDDDGQRIIGSSMVQAIYIDPTPPERCAPVNIVVLHEGMHAIAPEAEHSSRGAFHPYAEDSYIDETSLESICSFFGCQEFNPER